MADDGKEVFEGKTFDVSGSTWTASVLNNPFAKTHEGDSVEFDLSLRNESGETRTVKVLGSHAGITIENHAPALQDAVRLWLGSSDPQPVVCYFGKPRF